MEWRAKHRLVETVEMHRFESVNEALAANMALFFDIDRY